MMRSVLFWLLFPFALPQALWVRKKATRLPEAGGPREGRVGVGRKFNLIAIGDSIVAGVGAAHLTNALVGRTAWALAEALNAMIEWRAYGQSGANCSAIYHQLLPQLPDKEADFIIVSAGVNDVTSLTTVANWTRNLTRLLEALANHSPRAVIVMAGIPPLKAFPLLPQPLRTLLGIRSEILDVAARRVVSGLPRAMHVPLDFDLRPELFAADGYHPSEASYREYGRFMAELIAKKLMELEQALQ